MTTPLIKYCGNRTLGDYLLTANSHADYLGFVFYKKSKRVVPPEVVGEWVSHGPKITNKLLVGVFVNPSLEEIDYVLKMVNLDIIQLHGLESPQWVNTVKSRFGKKVWKAIHHDTSSLERMRSYRGFVDGYVIDCKAQNLWGGTGLSFDWSVIPDYRVEAEHQGVPYFIAGGISPTNIEELLTYQPAGIDLASGIEMDGKKSKQLIHELERKVVGFNEHLSR